MSSGRETSRDEEKAEDPANAMARAYSELLSSSSALNFRQTRLDILRALTTNEGGASLPMMPTANRRQSTTGVEDTHQRTNRTPSFPAMNMHMLSNMQSPQRLAPSPSLMMSPLKDNFSEGDLKPMPNRRHSMPLGMSSVASEISGSSQEQANEKNSIPFLLAKLRQATQAQEHRQSIGGLASGSLAEATASQQQESTSTISDMSSLMGYLRNQSLSSPRPSIQTHGGLAAAVSATHQRPSLDHMSISEMKGLYGGKLDDMSSPMTPSKQSQSIEPIAFPNMNLYSRFNRFNEPTTLRNSLWYQDPMQTQEHQASSKKKRSASSDDGKSNKKKRCRRTRDEQWNIMYERLVEYKKKNGDCLVHWQYKEDIQLGRWVSKQREYRHDLSEDRRKRLEDIGFVWVATGVSHQNQWDEMFGRLLKYKEKHGHCQVPWLYQEDRKLVGWVQNQRRRKHTLSAERKSRLDAIGFAWEGIRGKYTRVPGKHKRLTKEAKTEEKKQQSATDGGSITTAASTLTASCSEDESSLDSNPGKSLPKTATSFTRQEDEIILKAIVGKEKPSANGPVSAEEPDLGYWEMLRGLAHNKSVEDLYQRATELSLAKKKAERKAASEGKGNTDEAPPTTPTQDMEAKTSQIVTPNSTNTAPMKKPSICDVEEEATHKSPNLSAAAPTQDEHASPVHVLMLAATAAAVAEDASTVTTSES